MSALEKKKKETCYSHATSNFGANSAGKGGWNKGLPIAQDVRADCELLHDIKDTRPGFQDLS